MGKIKSAIITTILVAALAVLLFFALFSWQVPGSNGVKRYNSFITSINLGSSLTGEAYAVLYPEGVISASDYNFNRPEIPADAEGDEKAEYEQKQAEYDAKYYKRGSNIYIDKDVFETYGEDEFIAQIKSDAEVLSKRFGEKGYSSYSVSVQDNYTIKVAVPTNFSYAAYKQYNATARSEATSAVSRAVQYLAYDGELSLRNSEVGTPAPTDKILTNISVDVTEFFSSITKYSMAGNYAVKVNLTSKGKEEFKNISNAVLDADSDNAIGFYVGENKLLSLTVSEAISGSFYIQTDEAYAQDYAIVLNSVANGETIGLNYNSADTAIVYAGAELGNLAAILLGVAMLLIIIGAIVYSVVRYKKLGLVNAIIIVMYSLTIIIALMLLGIQLTVAGAITAVLGLALLCGANFAAFEEVRKETKKGKTIQSSVKAGYKNLLAGILELHIVMVVVALMLALICVGELAACGLIFFIASIASYVLYWFTRFMWYVISAPVRNKFGFCGFTREELIDD